MCEEVKNEEVKDSTPISEEKKIPENWHGFMDKYPILFQRRFRSMKETCLCWGIECPIAWYNILTSLCDKLEKMNNLLGKKLGFEIQAEQVKEKFGTLRFYFYVIPVPVGEQKESTDETDLWTDEFAEIRDLIDDVVEDLVQYAEHLTYTHCQVCGKYIDEDTRFMSAGWIGYYCNECAEKKNLTPFPKKKEEV